MSENLTFLPTWALWISHFSTVTTPPSPLPKHTHIHTQGSADKHSLCPLDAYAFMEGDKMESVPTVFNIINISGGPHTNRYHWSVHHHMLVKPISVMGAGEKAWDKSCFMKLLRTGPEITFRMEAAPYLGKKVFQSNTNISLEPSLVATLMVGALFSRLVLLNVMCPGETLVQGNKVSHYAFNI